MLVEYLFELQIAFPIFDNLLKWIKELCHTQRSMVFCYVVLGDEVQLRVNVYK